MGSDAADKPGGRLARKTLGVTLRIWLLLAFFCAVVLFSRLVAPHADPLAAAAGARHRLIWKGGADLKPKNLLNVTDDEPSPFPFCPVFGPTDELAHKYGSLTLSKTRLHTGSNARVQRVIQKALLGLPVTFSVIGGSVSACHGAGDDPLSPTCYPARFLQWWNSVFPHPATEITNGAMRRVNSDYFGFCAAHHVPDVTDVVLLELDVDDDEDSLENFELLVRSLLLRADQPAVIILGHFAPQVHQSYGYVGPEHWHNVVAQFYDLPHISIKPVLYSEYMHDSAATMQTYFADPVLANGAGHQVLADVLVAYMQQQICATWSGATGHSYDSLPLLAADAVHVRQPSDARGLFGGAGQRKGGAAGEDGAAAPARPEKVKESPEQEAARNGLAAHLRVPPARINTRPSDLAARPFVEVAPFCASANDLVNPLPGSLFAGSGWEPHHPRTGDSDLYVGAHYWEARMPGSRFKVPVTVGAGDVGVFFAREPQSAVGAGSEVECWVDDNVAGARKIANMDKDVVESKPTLRMIDKLVGAGSHSVQCRLLGDEGRAVPPFKIMGIFTT